VAVRLPRDYCTTAAEADTPAIHPLDTRLWLHYGLLVVRHVEQHPIAHTLRAEAGAQ